MHGYKIIEKKRIFLIIRVIKVLFFTSVGVPLEKEALRAAPAYGTSPQDFSGKIF